MAENYTLEKINVVIKYVEENIKENITLDDISRCVNLSKYHLDRIFNATTRNKLMSYVENRKLTHSIYELLNTDLKIIDISTEYGFNHEQSFIRAFRNTFHISPGKFRKERPILEITDMLNTSFLTPIENDGLMIKPKILLNPGFSLIGIKTVINYNEDSHFYLANKAGKDFFYNYRHLIKSTVDADNYISIVQYIDENNSNYIPSLVVSKIEDIPKGMIALTTPSQKYAAFKYVGFHKPELITTQSLEKIHEFMFSKWLPNSGYTQSKPYHFESIDYKISREDYCEMDLFIPIT